MQRVKSMVTRVEPISNNLNIPSYEIESFRMDVKEVKLKLERLNDEIA